MQEVYAYFDQLPLFWLFVWAAGLYALAMLIEWVIDHWRRTTHQHDVT